MGIQQEPQYRQSQVGTQLPPQYEQPQQPPQPPKKGMFKKKRTWFIIAAIVVVLIIVVNAGKGGSPSSTTSTNSTSNSTTTQNTQPTSAPAQALKWTTTHTFTGNGTKKTAVFTVGSDWKISWSCTPSSFYGGKYNVQAYVYNSDGSLADVGVNSICSSSNTHDITEEHQSGDVYLDVNSEGAWKIQVQELK